MIDESYVFWVQESESDSPQPWDDQKLEIWGVLLLFLRKISLYLC